MTSHKNKTLEQTLFDQAFAFDFYQAVRLIELLHPEKVSVGEESEADREAVRFKPKVSFEFPASAVYDIIRSSSDDTPHEMVVNFMGLAGNHGPLPAPYTEFILERLQKKDRALKDFLDIFNHRLISLMYRVRKTYRIGFDFKSPDQSSFAGYLFSLMGMGTGGLRQRMAVQDRALLFYTTILSQQPRSMSGLETVLSDFFKIRVKGKPLCGKWYPLAQDQVTRLGITGQNQHLGHNLVIGTRIWDQQGHFELEIGPLMLYKFLDFLPEGRAYTPLCQMTRFYAGAEFEFDFLLILKSEEVPGTRLSAAKGSRLGWTSWLRTPNYRDDVWKPRRDTHGMVKIKGR
ncbi:MAG: type VI secretion system baseplate subunit TssG [Desulfobacterales bacterium]|nr:type VI secretion system baseplate subunit TssG [Desulfobacterales bacterium]